MEKYDITLLLVEDDKIIRNVYGQILGQVIARVVSASNGEAGYAAFLEHSPDVILTDIKMPVMNGLDMINKIRTHNKDIRIIIMSAYGDSRFFLKAIESGVKGFLSKPINNDVLIDIVLEQVKDILLERNLHLEEKKRRDAELERDRSENILQVLSFATASFFSKGVNSLTVNQALSKVGNTTKVSRVYIFKKDINNDIEYITQIYEWASEGIIPEINNEELSNIPVDSLLFGRWSNILRQRKNIISIVRLIENEQERKKLQEQDIKSVLAIPIFVRDEWWGFIGFDDCLKERSWSDAEVNALEMLAFNLGGAIYRRNVEDELNRLNSNLEEHVKERTLALEQEVVERRLTEELLRESEEKYRLIYENANDGILLIKNGIVFLINPRVSDIFERKPKEIIGREFSSLFVTSHTEQINTFFSDYNTSGHHLRTEMVLEMLDNQWIELKVTLINWDNELAHLAFISDITKRKRAEKELFEFNLQLEKRIKTEISRVEQQQQLLVQKSKLESIGELSAGLAHEINQPLGGISMGLDNIQINALNGTLDNTYLKDKINKLFGDVERIKKIIDHVRIFSRDQEKLDFEVVDIKQVIKDALSLVITQFTDHQVVVETVLPKEEFSTLGNNYRLEQVFLNLFSNAKYAVEEKARSITNEPFTKQIRIQLSSDEHSHCVVIEDNGTGIDSKHIANIFNPFYTTKSEEKGTGLGLSISYGIIKEMDGQILVESELQHFTRIIINLPKN